MRTVSVTETLNLPVISLDSGHRLGECHGYVFDASKKALALQVRQKGLFSRYKVIPYPEISHIGKDAIVVPSEKNLGSPRKMPEIAQAIEEKVQVLGAQVLTEKGENLGLVQEVLLEASSGKIDSILVSQGMFKDLTRGPSQISFQEIKKIGPDRIIVSAIAKKGGKTVKKPGVVMKSFEKAVIAAGRLSGQAKRKLSGRK